MSAPNAESSVTGTHSQPMSRISAIFHHRSVALTNSRAAACIARAAIRLGVECAARATQRGRENRIDSVLCDARRSLSGSIPRNDSPLPNRTSMTISVPYIAKESTPNTALIQENCARPSPSNQYSGPIAVHRLSHRHAAMAKAQRAAAAMRKLRARGAAPVLRLPWVRGDDATGIPCCGSWACSRVDEASVM